MQQIITKAIPKDEWFFNKEYNYNEFVYSLTKFVSNHKNEYDFLKMFYSNSSNKTKNDIFIKIFKTHKEKIKDIDKKQDKARLMDIFIKIFSIKTFYLKKLPKKVSWNYEKISLSFLNYCTSKNMNVESCKVIIDDEKNTLKSMQQYKKLSVSCADSKDEIAVRICDWIAGFVGKIMFSYSKQIKNLKDIEFTENLPLLEEKCFEFRNDQKKLISQIYDLFIIQQNNFWATTTSIYSDYTMLFYTFIRYCESEKEKLNSSDFNLLLHEEFIYTCLNTF